jgi:uncharacterized RDD family membrane protein YckC
MADPGARERKTGFEVKPHAYDPVTHPELFDGVLARRVVAFCIDVVILSVPLLVLAVFIFVLGLVTLGLGWALYFLLSPVAVLWALIYYGMTLGGPHSATVGMRLTDIEMRTWYGAPAYFVLGAVHAVFYWISVSVLTPFILLFGLFNDRRRLLHDFALGVVFINNPERAHAKRAGWSATDTRRV